MFLNYDDSYTTECIKLFNQNCPEFFAEVERDDYLGFLETRPSDYYIGVINDSVVSAFGISSVSNSARSRLSWILVSPKFKGIGIGGKMINYAIQTALENRSAGIDIAASHLSAPFFAKFGAKEVKRIQNGWGRNMHRVDMEVRL